MITPEQAAALTDVPVDVTAYLAVKGGCSCCYGSACDPETAIPPADLAALVEQRCETWIECPRCHGDPEWALGCVVCNPSGRSVHVGIVKCSDCHDGKPLHAIQYQCDGSGVVSLPGLWTYDALLPVFAWGDVTEWSGSFVAVASDGRYWPFPESDDDERDAITVHGTPEQFVLAVTRRTQ